MELLLQLAIVRGTRLPVNYQYELSSWIHRIIERADQDYQTFIIEKGFQPNGSNFKLFTFSQLDLRPYVIQGDLIALWGKTLSLKLRFHIDSGLGHFVESLLIGQRFELGNRLNTIDLEVTRVEVTPPVNFLPLMKYQYLSPICVSRTRGDGSIEYLSPEQDGYAEHFILNLYNKISPQPPLEELSIATDYHFELLNTPRKKGVHIKLDTSEHTQVIGYLFNFELIAPIEMHEIGYYAGFGDNNSLGFGCVKKCQSE